MVYLHVICVADAEVKEAVLRAAGFWFLDSDRGEALIPCLVPAAFLGLTPGLVRAPANLPRAGRSLAGCRAHPRATSGVPACRPLSWRQPDAEAHHYSCPTFELGLVHGGEPAAAAAARAGVRGKAAEQLFDLLRDKTC